MTNYSSLINPSKLEEALAADAEDRRDEDWHLIELAAEKWLASKPRPFWGDDPSGYVNGDLSKPDNHERKS